MGLLLTVFGTTQIGAATVFSVGNKSVSLEDFKKRYDDLRKNPMAIVPSVDEFLEEMIRYEVGVQEGEKQGLQNDPIVKERLRQEIYKALVEKALGEKVNSIKVTEPEMKRYYEKNPDIRASHIVVEFKVGANAQEKAIAKERALKILNEVKGKKKDFAEEARLVTDDPLTRDRGGDLDFVSRITIAPDVYDALLKAKVGEIIGPLETRFGYQILKVTGRRTYAEVPNKAPIRAAVFDQKRRDIFDGFFKSLKGKYKIEVNKSALKGLGGD